MVYQYVYLVVIGVIWLIIAACQDIKRKEIDNWVSFSLIAAGLSYRAFYSIIFKDYNFFIFGLIGLTFCFIMANVFYYSRVFAGGDAKLLIGLGPFLVFGSSFLGVLFSMFFFVFILLASGSVYGIVYSFFIIMQDRKKLVSELKRNFKIYKKSFYYSSTLLALSLIAALIFDRIIFILSILFIVFPFLLVYAKSTESFMIKKRKISELTIGDWLFKDVKFRVNEKNKIIKASWEGLSEKELELLRKHYRKDILTKEGIVFAPIFLIAFILFAVLWYSSWFFNLFLF